MGILPSIRRQATRLLTLNSASLRGTGKSQQAIFNMVTHLFTNHAQHCLTSVNLWELGTINVLSPAPLVKFFFFLNLYYIYNYMFYFSANVYNIRIKMRFKSNLLTFSSESLE